MSELNETSPKKKSGVLVGAIVALIVIIAVIIYLILTKQTATAPTSNNISATSTNTTPGVSNLNTTDTSNSVTNNTASNTTNTTNTTSTTSNTATPKTVEVDLTGTSFQFSKKEITVSQNDKVTIKFTSEGGEHNFVLDGYNLMSQTVASGETSSVSFTADKKGTFNFYCGIANYRDKGMEGTLIVQ